ncbi:hypothetical protein A2U01_0113266, partial [Trifolium medium]|nr:hypothetical protein [Trifolium medium]
MVGKFRSNWIGPFVVTNVFPRGAVEIKSAGTNKVFKVKRQRLKLLHKGVEGLPPKPPDIEAPA